MILEESGLSGSWTRISFLPTSLMVQAKLKYSRMLTQSTTGLEFSKKTFLIDQDSYSIL